MRSKRLVKALILSGFLVACQSQPPLVSKSQALAILRKINREINFSSANLPPSRYVLNEYVSTYEDNGLTVQNVRIRREIDKENHYSYAKILGTHLDRPYIHETWTYVSLRNNVICHFLNIMTEEGIVNRRYRYEGDKNFSNWEKTAYSEITEMSRLYGQMPLSYYSYIKEMDDVSSESYRSANDLSLVLMIENEKAKYSASFADSLFIEGSVFDKRSGYFYSASVSWNKCDISMPDLNFYDLLAS